MIRFKEENDLEAFIPKKEKLLELEEVLVGDIPVKDVFIYDISAFSDYCDIGPEKCVEFFLENEEEFSNLLSHSRWYQLLIEYLDSDHHISMIFSNTKTTLLVKGYDKDWVSEKVKQVREFLEAKKAETMEENKDLLEEEIGKIETNANSEKHSKIQKNVPDEEAGQKLGSRIATGCAALFIVVITLAVVGGLVYFFMFRDGWSVSTGLSAY